MADRIAAVALAAAALVASAAQAASFRSGQIVMGTVLNVTVEHEDAAVARRLAESAVDCARHWDDVLTIWRSDGELARLNANAGHSRAVSPDLERALRAMQQLSDLTGGAFDPSVGPLVRIWTDTSRPTAAQVRTVPLGMRRVIQLKPGRARLQTRAELDPGGIGKGIALDAIQQMLTEGGAAAAFVDFGTSSQLAFTRHPAAQAEWVMLLSGLEPNTLLGRLRLRNGCVSTSRSLGEGGAIIDPRTRKPLSEQRIVTVLAPTSTQADAWSTALAILGRRGLPLARRRGIEALMQDKDGVARTKNFPLESS